MTQKDGLSRYRQREGPPAPAHSGSSRHLGEHRSSLPFLSLPFFSLSFLPSLILPFQSVLPATVIRQDYSQMALGHSWALRRASLLPPGSLGRLCEDPTYERNLLQRKLKKKTHTKHKHHEPTDMSTVPHPPKPLSEKLMTSDGRMACWLRLVVSRTPPTAAKCDPTGLQ